MKTAQYYIDLVFDHHHTDEEWHAIFEEVMEWLKTCPPDQEEEFALSGAGETLYMICT